MYLCNPRISVSGCSINNANLYGARIHHVVALKALLHYFVHQTHKASSKTIILMLIKRHFRLFLNNNIITTHYIINKNGDIVISVKLNTVSLLYIQQQKTAVCIIGKLF